MSGSQRPHGLDRATAWWEFVRRPLMFLGGFGILGYETVAEHADRPYLILAAVGLISASVLRAVAEALGKISGAAREEQE